MSNVSVTNETIAGRRLFPLRQINFDGREKTFCVIDLRTARSRPGVAPRITAPRPPNRSETHIAGSKLLHPVKESGERLIVCTRHAKKRAGRARHVMSSVLCFSPGNLRRLARRRCSKAVLIVISQRWLGRPFGGNEAM